jgi:hypothetical protein
MSIKTLYVCFDSPIFLGIFLTNIKTYKNRRASTFIEMLFEIFGTQYSKYFSLIIIYKAIVWRIFQKWKSYLGTVLSKVYFK